MYYERRPLQPLTSSEFEVMKAVWDGDHDLTLQEILDYCCEKYNKQWKRQTVATFLSHLISKGVAESYRVGRYFYYKPIIDEKHYKELETQKMIDFWYKGSVAELLASLSEYDSLPKDKAAKLAELVKEL